MEIVQGVAIQQSVHVSAERNMDGGIKKSKKKTKRERWMDLDDIFWTERERETGREIWPSTLGLFSLTFKFL